MKLRDRSFTRNTNRKAKSRTKKIMKEAWLEPDEWANPKNIGRWASVHTRKCSCYMCGNPRKHFNKLTMQERKAQLKEE